jgi:CreA protein
MKTKAALLILTLGLIASPALSEEIGCVTTAWKLIGANHKICIDAFDDPKIPGVTCHLSQARAGGISGSLGLASDPSKFSIACRQIGPITMPSQLKDNEVVFSEDTSILFKETRVIRMFDQKRNTLIYLVYSTKMIDGSPMNSISTVPIMPWRP